MSRARKHVLQGLDDTPELTKTQRICKVTELRGDNIFEVQVNPQDESKVLVLLPQKFKKLIWVKRGDFVIVDDFKESEYPVHRGKVVGFIDKILRPDHIRDLRKEGVFNWEEKNQKELVNDFEIEGNPNRLNWSDDSDKESDEDDDEDDEGQYDDESIDE